MTQHAAVCESRTDHESALAAASHEAVHSDTETRARCGARERRGCSRCNRLALEEGNGIILPVAVLEIVSVIAGVHERIDYRRIAVDDNVSDIDATAPSAELVRIALSS